MDFLCVGEMLADIIVRSVSEVKFNIDSVPVEEIIIKTGGDALNNSVNLSRLGNSVTYVGRVGGDIIGDFLLDKAQDEGINMDHVVKSKTPHTKVTILIKENGDRSFFYYPGTSAELCYEDVDLSLLNNCKILQIGGTFHLPKFDGEGAAKLLKAAKAKSVLTSMDVTKDFTGRWNEIIQPCYEFLDYFLPSIEQAELIAREKEVPKIAEFFLGQGVKNVVLKLGKKGAYFRNKDKAFYCNSYDVNAVDTTGAGDSFVSGFLTGVLKGFEIEECVKLGTAASAFTVQSVGATTGMKDYETVKAFMKKEKGLEIKYDTL